MAYSSANPPRRIIDEGIYSGGPATATAMSSNDNGGGSIWLYRSTHGSTEILPAGFFKAGDSLGMRVGDIMLNMPLSAGGSSRMTMHPVVGSSFGTSNATTGSTYGGRYDYTVGTAT